jgi:hypothetical protein
MSRRKSKKKIQKPMVQQTNRRRHNLILAGLLGICIMLALGILLTPGPRILPQANAQQVASPQAAPPPPASNPATTRPRPTTQQVQAAIARAKAATQRAATQRAATRPRPVLSVSPQALAIQKYQRLQGELAFMQDHLSRVRAAGQSGADVQSIQNTINDLQNQVQSAAATTQPAQ